MKEPPAAVRETAAVIVVVEESTCTGGPCEGSLDKRNTIYLAAHKVDAVGKQPDDENTAIRELERRDGADITIHDREQIELREADADIVTRDPSDGDLEPREAEPDPEPICFNHGLCKREGESQ